MSDYKEKLTDANLIICRCEEITKGDILDAIKDGYTTVSGIRKRTRAGMGFCQGKSCGRLVQLILKEYTDIDQGDIEPARVRPPVRPISAGDFIKGADEL